MSEFKNFVANLREHQANEADFMKTVKNMLDRPLPTVEDLEKEGAKLASIQLANRLCDAILTQSMSITKLDWNNMPDDVRAIIENWKNKAIATKYAIGKADVL